MSNPELIDNLVKLGLPLFTPNPKVNTDEVIVEVVKSHDYRLWEAFPVLLANATERYHFDPIRIYSSLNDDDCKLYQRLIILSLSMYSLYHLSFSWAQKFKKSLSIEEKNYFKEWKVNLESNKPLFIDCCNGLEFDSSRLKKTFSLYFEQSKDKDMRSEKRYKDLSVAYALSQIFSPKQAELFKKKLDGEPLSKTEQEYYSRSVKRKVVALANADLHSMARKLIEQ
jgi:hypothetical protein